MIELVVKCDLFKLTRQTGTEPEFSRRGMSYISGVRARLYIFIIIITTVAEKVKKRSME